MAGRWASSLGDADPRGAMAPRNPRAPSGSPLSRVRHPHPPLGTIALLVAVLAYPGRGGLTSWLERLQAGVEARRGRLCRAREGRRSRRVACLAQIQRCGRPHRGARGAQDALPMWQLRAEGRRCRAFDLAWSYEGEAGPGREAELKRDIAELDGLIEEVLLASRLDAVRDLDVCEEVDLLAPAAEEASRCDGAQVTGVPSWCAVTRVRGGGRAISPERCALALLLLRSRSHDRTGARGSISATPAAAFRRPKERIFEPFPARPGYSLPLGGAGRAGTRSPDRASPRGEAMLAAAEGCSLHRIVVELPAAQLHLLNGRAPARADFVAPCWSSALHYQQLADVLRRDALRAGRPRRAPLPHALSQAEGVCHSF